MAIYSDADKIYEAGKKSIAGASWKAATQLFEANQLLETAHILQALENRTYEPDCGRTFMINERGKHRMVTSIPCIDKTVNHVVCDEVLSPLLEPFLIYDNGASREGKGVAFCRERFERHMREYYQKYSNKGYILLGDFKSYYASIDAPTAIDMLIGLLAKTGKLSGEDLDQTRWLLETILGDGIGVNIGGQISQNVGITFAHRVDNYVKTVMGQRFYARYSDDFYCIHRSKEFLMELTEGIKKSAAEVGLTIHPNKTHITRIDKPFRFLQISYRMTGTGKLVRRINPNAVTRERHRLRAYHRLVEKGRMTRGEAENAFKSWMVANYEVMSIMQIQNLNDLYTELFEEEIKWKNSRLRYLTGPHSKISK